MILNPQQNNKFDVTIEALLYALLAFMPFAFGAVQPWSEQVVLVLSVVIGGVFLTKLIVAREMDLCRSWVYVPVALFMLVAVFQLIPLPAAVISAISPNTASIKTELLSGLPHSQLPSMTLSFYPNATRHDLRLVLAIATLFCVVLNTFRRPEQIKRLLTAITGVGGAVAVLALAQDLTDADKIYWSVPIHNPAYSGPFVLYSHYAQFMNLSMGAALGLVFVRLTENFKGKQVDPPSIAKYVTSPSGKVIGYLLGMIILGAATIFLSLSRAGVISLLMAASFTALMCTCRRSVKGTGWIMVLLALGAFACVLYLGFDAVYDRLATLRDIHRAQGGRIQILKDIAIAWTEFPVFGTGLGTHEVVYPMFDRSTVAALAVHAENEYAQAAEETGLLGLGSLAVFALFVGLSYVRSIRSVRHPIHVAAYGLGFGLLAILIHSFSDFGQHLPANAALSAVFCAILIVLARQSDTPATASHPGTSHNRRSRIFVMCMLGMLVAGGVASLFGANAARRAQSHWNKALTVEAAMTENNWQGSDEDYIELISQAAAASQLQPGNVKYRHWLNVYRWHSISRMIDSQTGIMPDEAMQFASRIIDDFYKAIAVCPTFGPSWCVAGQLKVWILNDTSGSAMIEEGYRLAPCDPTACFVAGELNANQALEEAMARADSLIGPDGVVSVPDSPVLLAACEKLDRSVELDGKFFTKSCDIYLDRLNRPDLAVALAGDKSDRLNYVIDRLETLDRHDELTEQSRQHLFELLRSKSRASDAPAWIFAALANQYKKQDAFTESIEYYHRALGLDYDQVVWRLELARLLAQTDQPAEAIRQARICLRLQPQFRAAEKLIGDLSVQ